MLKLPLAGHATDESRARVRVRGIHAPTCVRTCVPRYIAIELADNSIRARGINLRVGSWLKSLGIDSAGRVKRAAERERERASVSVDDSRRG